VDFELFRHDLERAVPRAKLRQKDRDARWTAKSSKARPREDGMPQVDIAVPAFGCKNRVSIDRRHGLICRWMAAECAPMTVRIWPNCSTRRTRQMG
jgi:hypothetical protein